MIVQQKLVSDASFLMLKFELNDQKLNSPNERP